MTNGKGSNWGRDYQIKERLPKPTPMVASCCGYDREELEEALDSAQGILEAAAGEMADRAKTYDKPQGERSMGATVKAFEAITGVHMTEQQGWQFMEVLKMVRSNQGAYRADSFIDGAAYAALAGEAASRG